MNIDFAGLFSGGVGSVVAIVLLVGSFIWYVSSQNSKLNDHEKRIVSLEASTTLFNSKLNDIAVAVGRIESSLQILLKDKS